MSCSFYCILIPSLLSITASFLILTCFLCKKELRRIRAKRYFIVIQLLDGFLCISTIINPNDNKNLCTFQASIQQFFNLMMIFWNIIIATSLYYEEPLYKGRKKFPYKKSSFFALTLSGIVALIIYLTDDVESNGIFCSVKSTGEHWYSIYIVFYIPLILGSIWNSFCLWQVIKLNKEKLMVNTYRDKNRLFISYSICLFFCYIFVFISRILENAKIDQGYFNCFSFSVVLLHGFFNAIIVSYVILKNKNNFQGSLVNEDEINEISDALKGFSSLNRTK